MEMIQIIQVLKALKIEILVSILFLLPYIIIELPKNLKNDKRNKE